MTNLAIECELRVGLDVFVARVWTAMSADANGSMPYDGSVP
jgi:hypothetical protein